MINGSEQLLINNQKYKYAGFWIRFVATCIDTLLLLAIISPLLIYFYGTEYFYSSHLIRGPADIILSYILPIIATLIFWKYKSATPGKMIFSIIIVDAETLQKPTNLQFIIRYFAYIVSIIPLCLGFLWIAFDKRKQGWHDKIARTVVIRKL